MAGNEASDPCQWRNFWSTITPDGTRYRHQLMARRPNKPDKPRLEWYVRTEVWQADEPKPYHMKAVNIPASHAKFIHSVLKFAWSNVDEEGRPMYPPEYPNGFANLGEHDA